MNTRWHLVLAACAAWGLLGCGGGGVAVAVAVAVAEAGPTRPSSCSTATSEASMR